MTVRDAESPLGRAFAIIDLVAAFARPVTVKEIAEGLEIPLPTAHRLVGNLEERGILQRSLGSKRLVVGTRMLDLAAKAIGAGFRRSSRHAILRAVSEKIGEQCEIGVVRDNLVTYVDAVRVGAASGLQFDPGVRAPLHCTSTGKLYMSRLPERVRRKLCFNLNLERFTPATITDPEALLDEVKRVRARGWAMSNEEFVKGVVGCAVPIFGQDSLLIGGLGISVPIARVNFAKLQKFIAPLQEAAQRLSLTIAEEEGAEAGAADMVR